MTEKAVVVYTTIDEHDGDTPVLTAVDGSGYVSDLPAGALWEPSWLLAYYSARFAQEGVIVIPRDWGSPDWRATVTGNGWSMREQDGTWTTFRKPGSGVVHVHRLDLANPRDLKALIRPDMKPDDIARTLDRWHRIAGAAYRATPGVVGTHILRSMFTGRQQPLWLDKPITVDGVALRGQGDIMWSAEPTGTDRGYLHGYDLVAQYVSALTTAVLPWDGLLRQTPPAFDPARAGYWRVYLASIPAAYWHRDVADRWPTLINPGRIELDDNSVWLTTPVLEYLAKSARVHPEILEAYLPDHSGPVLKTWAGRMAQLRRDTAGSDLYPTAKRTPNEAIGLMGREGGRCHRSDWRWITIDQSRVNLLRKLDGVAKKNGQTPRAIRVDAVWYASNSPDPVETAAWLGLRIGRDLGCWKVAGSMPISEWSGGIP